MCLICEWIKQKVRRLLCRLGFKAFCDPIIGADRVTVTTSAPRSQSMVQVNPGTKVTIKAQYTLAGVPGKFQAGTDAWTSNNAATDVLSNQVSDADAGMTSIDVDGTNSAGTTSIIHVTADVDRGAGDVELGGDSEEIVWTPAVEIVADGVTLSVALA